MYMNNTINIVTDALEYYDKNNEIYKKVLKRVKYYKVINTSVDVEHNKIILYDENKQQILESRYEIIGKYLNDMNVWLWAWSIARYYKNDIYTIKKVLNYAIDLPPMADVNYFKTELITSRIIINDPIKLDMLVSVASYIAKIPLIYNLVWSPLLKNDNLPDENGLYKLIDINSIKVSEFENTYFYLLDYKNIK